VRKNYGFWDVAFMLEQANFVPKPLILVGEVQILMERRSRVTMRCWSLRPPPLLKQRFSARPYTGRSPTPIKRDTVAPKLNRVSPIRAMIPNLGRFIPSTLNLISFTNSGTPLERNAISFGDKAIPASCIPSLCVSR